MHANMCSHVNDSETMEAAAAGAPHFVYEMQVAGGHGPNLSLFLTE